MKNVTRGRGIPPERLHEVAEHYYHFGGKSPINDQCRELIAALRPELDAHGINLPIYWGNRNWHPYLSDALRQMRDDGKQRALALVTSAYSSYSGCRQYRENIASAQAELGEGAPKVDKIRVFYNHPGFIDAMTQRVQAALKQFPDNVQGPVHFVATAHSIPCSMADTSDYVKQLSENLRLLKESTGLVTGELVFQSRSGPPTQPWLAPDILDHIRHLHSIGVKNLLIAPIGFISDHLEVMFDLDTEAHELCQELGMNMVRVPTAGTHPAFMQMLRQLIVERISESEQKLAIGHFPPNHDVCPVNCCPPPVRPARGLAQPSNTDKSPVSANPSASPRP